MKHNLLKAWLMLCLMLIGVGSAWADSKTFNLQTTSDVTESSADQVTWVKSPVTVQLDKGSGTAANNYLGTSSQTRVYNGNTFSVTVADGYYLTSVEITSTAASYVMPTSNWTGGTASLSNAVVTVTANEKTTSVSVNPGGTKRLTQVVVYYTAKPAEDPFNVTLNDTKEIITETSAGAGVTLPSRSNIGVYSFKGWSETNIETETTDAPTIIKAGSYKPSKNVILYPVYSRLETITGSMNKTVSTTMKDYATANEWETSNNTTKYLTVNLDDVVSVVADEKGTTGQWNSNNFYWGMYQTSTNKSVWRVKSNAGDLVSVTFTYTSQNSGIISYDGSTYESDAEVSLSGKTSGDFTVANTSTATNGQARITAISVTYVVTGGTIEHFISNPTVPSSATITLNAACNDGEKVYSTYSNASAWVVPAELTVSEVGVNDGKLKVVSYTTGDVVPANTGVMVSADKWAEGTKDFNVTLSNETGAHPEDVTNALHPSSEAMTGDNLFYRLTMHNGNQIGFWWGAADGAAFSLGANKAYLAVPTTTSAKAMNFWFGDEEDADAIKAVKADSNEVIYNLSGQRINKMHKGINIVNGKKILK